MKHLIQKIASLTVALTVLISCNTDENKADAYGNFQSDATTISSESMGKLILLNINEGNQVKKGELVAVVDTTQLSLKKEQLYASFISIDSQSKSVLSQISVLEEQLKVQKINLDRTKKMYKEKSATKKQLDDIQGQVNVTKQQITSVKAQNASVISQYKSMRVQIKQVEDQINKSKITNPIDGTVLIKYCNNYEFVAPGKPLYQVQNLTDIKLKAYITELQLSEIKIGDKVSIEVDSETDGKKFEGTISWVASNAEFTPKTIQSKDERQNLVYAIKIDVKNDGSLKIGMPASVYF